MMTSMGNVADMAVMALNNAQAKTAKDTTRNLPKRSPNGP
jgi:hypothetical protein